MHDRSHGRAGARRALRAVVFDFGKTLATVRPSVEDFFGKHAQRLGRSVAPSDLRRYIRDAWPLVTADAYADELLLERCWVALYRQVLHAAGATWDDAARGAESMWQDHALPDAYQLVDGALETLRALRARDLTVAILSNFDSSLDAKLRYLGISPLVSHVFCSATVGLAKPDPRFLEHGRERLGVERDELLYVGDDPACDRTPCEGLGIDCLIVEHDSERDPSAGTISTLRGVVAHVERRNSVSDTLG